MPRKLRNHIDGAFYHVMLRGNFRGDLFFSDDNYQYFYSLMKSVAKKYGCFFHLFCLMTNHVHLVVEVGYIPLHKIMQSITSRYACYVNKSLQRQGHLFQGRYRSKIIMDDKYLLELCFYIHNNPLCAKMVDKLDEYPWSSHHCYAKESSFEWLKIEFIMQIIQRCSLVENQHYLQFMLDREKASSKPQYCSFNDDGELTVIDSMVQHAAAHNPMFFSHISLDQLLDIICDYLDVNMDELRSSSRNKRLILGRCLATYFLHYRSRHTLKSVAHSLDRNPDALSRTLNNYLAKMSSEIDHQKILHDFEAYLVKRVGNDPML